jgi:2-phospho-L-lactate/phosphoenolpyruvate guanylyltransferase
VPSPPVEPWRASWCLVVPVKRLALAKTRLAGVAGEHRVDLALAFALDTVTAALSCDVVRAVVVVTDEPDAARALAAAGALVVTDEPDAGLNPALVRGADVAARTHPGAAVGALSADLPTLRPDELRAALDAAPDDAAAFVRDAEGSGTTTLLARRRGDFVPAFGPGSADGHLSAGAVELHGDAFPSLRLDVDTAADLEQALAMGVGVHTAAVAGRLTLAGCR